MRTTAGRLILSATDLSRFLGCRHCTGLDLDFAMSAGLRPQKYAEPFFEIRWRRGLEHERKCVDTLRTATRTIIDRSEARHGVDMSFAQAIDAMREGTIVHTSRSFASCA